MNESGHWAAEVLMYSQRERAASVALDFSLSALWAWGCVHSAICFKVVLNVTDVYSVSLLSFRQLHVRAVVDKQVQYLLAFSDIAILVSRYKSPLGVVRLVT